MQMKHKLEEESSGVVFIKLQNHYAFIYRFRSTSTTLYNKTLEYVLHRHRAN